MSLSKRLLFAILFAIVAWRSPEVTRRKSLGSKSKA